MAEYTEYVTDPTDGTEYSFTGESPEEVADKIDAHFNPVFDYDGLSDDEKRAMLADLTKQREEMQPVLDKTGPRYAGTPEGLAKLQRTMELKPHGDPERELYASYIQQGIGQLASEAEQRKAKGYRVEHQGPREPLPLPDGETDALIEFLVQNRILGNFKVDDQQIMRGQTQATLYWMPADRRFNRDPAESINVTYPDVIISGGGVSLCDVVVEAPRDRILKLLGLDLGEALLNVIDAL